MKHALKMVIVLVTIVLIAACTTTGRHLYYHEAEPEAELTIEGALPLVSIQLSGRSLSWSEQGGNIVTTYTFEFNDANGYANMVFDYLPLKELGIGIPETLRKGDVRLTEYLDYRAWIRNESYDWGIPVVDEKGTAERMDPNILTCLNETVDSEYYLVLNADIIDHQWSAWFGLIPFRIVYEFSAVVYDRDGRKVVSRHYRHPIKQMPGSIYEARTYYDGLEIALEQVKDEITADLKELGASPDAETESFTEGAI